MQASLLLLKLLRVPHPTIHVLLNVNHKAIEDMEKRICDLRKAFVEKREKNVVFGDGRTWKDVEAATCRPHCVYGFITTEIRSSNIWDKAYEVIHN